MDFVYVHGETPIAVATQKDPQLAILEGYDIIQRLTHADRAPNTVWLNAGILPGLQYKLTLEHSLKEHCGISLHDRPDLPEGVFILFNSEVSTAAHPLSSLVLKVPEFIRQDDNETMKALEAFVQTRSSEV